MIGVIIPAHNEELLLGASLHAALASATHPRLNGEPVRILVVLDACTDGSAGVAAQYPVESIETDCHNVGTARGLGAECLLAEGARWLAFTDADSRVAPTWLADQLALEAEAVCGCVTVDDWSEHAPGVRERHEQDYQDRDGHRHIHGANFGVSAEAYRRAGGFEALALSEDAALVDALHAAGCRIAWSAVPRVITSGRAVSRVQGGFADFLQGLAETPAAGRE